MTCCTQWGGTPSDCPRSSTPSIRAPTRGTIHTYTQSLSLLHTALYTPLYTIHYLILPPSSSSSSSFSSTCSFSVTTYENIANFKRQLKSLGFSYDWDRELATTDDAYVRWTQWIFLKLVSVGLASQSEVSVNWCEALGTVLANEEIIDGLSERGAHPVVRRPLRQVRYFVYI